ncbi:asparagine synthase [Halobacteriales archaeon QH_2_65_14]|nr:MAG: asparagine synthase [Halobacteriales archaeon QH_2_65_14]
MTLTGADGATVRAALDSGDPLPGTGGFAGELDGALVRDVLGRYPLFFEADGSAWSHDHTDLTDPVRLPAGHVRAGGETSQQWTLRQPRRVDSSLLAARLDIPLYTVGFPDSHDVEAARSAAAVLGADLRVVELDHETLERAVPEVANAIGRTNAMDVEIALPLYVLAERARADGIEGLALGQGVDELFGGYAKVARAPEDPRVEADTVRGARREVVGTLPGQFERDWLAVHAGGLTPVTPYVHDRIVAAALRLPGELLVGADGERKRAFRLAAREWLPDELADREKKALQYGSLVARELDRLARQAGFKRRMDDHVTQFVEHLLESRA